MCSNAHSEELNNLQTGRTQFGINVHRAVDIFQVKKQSVCNNANGEELNNLQTERTQFSIHVHRAVDILHGNRTISG